MDFTTTEPARTRNAADAHADHAQATLPLVTQHDMLDNGGQTETLRKAVDALAIVPTRQRIYPLARKLYNVMLYIAQKQGSDRDTYRAPLFDIVSKAKFNSKDMKLVKNHLRAMNATQVEWQSPTEGEGARWDISNLIAHATIEEPGSGKPVMIEWSFAPNIKKELLSPERFAQISLVFQSTLRTHASIALFEICSRYMDNPSKLTAKRPWEWWRPVLTGVPESEVGAYAKYKYFKRDVLTPAMKEINRITELQVDMIEHKEGRFIRELQFKVQRKSPKAITAPAKLDLSLVGPAVTLGVSQQAAEAGLEKFGSTTFTAATKVLNDRRKATGVKPIESIDRYFQGVLKRIANDKPASETIEPAAATPSDVRPTRADLQASYRDAKRREARNEFENLNAKEQEKTLKRFEKEFINNAPQVLSRAYKKNGLNNPALRIEFNQWFAQELWGAEWARADADALLELVTQQA